MAGWRGRGRPISTPVEMLLVAVYEGLLFEDSRMLSMLSTFILYIELVCGSLT